MSSSRGAPVMVSASAYIEGMKFEEAKIVAAEEVREYQSRMSRKSSAATKFAP
jgi:hypothetical protein